MTNAAAWSLAYARQADSDFRAWELFEQHPKAAAAECHKLLFLQMSCEKLCKAYLIRSGTAPELLQGSHGFIAGPLPLVIRWHILATGQMPDRMQGVFQQVRYLAQEIEVLNPAVDRGGRRPDNCEYPWETGGFVLSPLDWNFTPLRLLTQPAGRTFVKLLRGLIDRMLNTSSNFGDCP